MSEIGYRSQERENLARLIVFSDPSLTINTEGFRWKRGKTISYDDIRRTQIKEPPRKSRAWYDFWSDVKEIEAEAENVRQKQIQQKYKRWDDIIASAGGIKSAPFGSQEDLTNFRKWPHWKLRSEAEKLLRPNEVEEFRQYVWKTASEQQVEQTQRLKDEVGEKKKQQLDRWRSIGSIDDEEYFERMQELGYPTERGETRRNQSSSSSTDTSGATINKRMEREKDKLDRMLRFGGIDEQEYEERLKDLGY
ncbi:MAG TPA: hypothetical protein VGT05_04200 [Patescibacteria group bacterium]|nr:hypothetical protein [Patescibacteria group bacterium]